MEKNEKTTRQEDMEVLKALDELKRDEILRNGVKALKEYFKEKIDYHALLLEVIRTETEVMETYDYVQREGDKCGLGIYCDFRNVASFFYEVSQLMELLKPFSQLPPPYADGPKVD